MNQNNKCCTCDFWRPKEHYNVIPAPLEGSYGTCKSNAFAYDDVLYNRTKK